MYFFIHVFLFFVCRRSIYFNFNFLFFISFPSFLLLSIDGRANRSKQERAENRVRLAKESYRTGGGGDIGGGGGSDGGDIGGIDGGGGGKSMGPVNVDERELAAYGRRSKDWSRVVRAARANPGYSVVRAV